MHILSRSVVTWVRERKIFFRTLIVLIRAGAHTVSHKDKTLLAHLIGVYVLLGAWETDFRVRVAGLLHSVYGTSIFTRVTIPTSKRKNISDIVSVEAERLAFLFSMSNRPDMWRTLTPTSEVLPLKNGISMKVTPKEVAFLAQMECANLVDQGALPGEHIIFLSTLEKTVVVQTLSE